MKWKERGLPMPTRPEPEVCEICGLKDRVGRRLALDHDHGTGAFRGWLCGHCNLGIGMLGDDTIGLRKALHYLEKSKTA